MNFDILTWLGLGMLFPSYRERAKICHRSICTLSNMIDEKRLALSSSIPGYAAQEDCEEIFPLISKECENGNLPKGALTIETMTIFGAGQGTTASLVVAALYFMAHHEELQDELRREVNEHIYGQIPESNSDLAELKLCKAVLEETLRLVPSVVVSAGYQAVEDVPIGPNGILPAGSAFNFCLIEMHRDPKYFEDPKKFDPYRWLTSDGAKLANMKKAFRPFGFGAPICPGQNLARSQALTVFAAIIKNFKVRISNEMKVEDPDDPFPLCSPMLSDVSGAVYEFEAI